MNLSLTPWSTTGTGTAKKIVDAKGRAVCAVFPRLKGDDNGAVLAAAPELLEALEALLFTAEGQRETLEGFEGYAGEPPSFGMARAALAKAKGGAR